MERAKRSGGAQQDRNVSPKALLGAGGDRWYARRSRTSAGLVPPRKPGSPPASFHQGSKADSTIDPAAAIAPSTVGGKCAGEVVERVGPANTFQECRPWVSISINRHGVNTNSNHAASIAKTTTSASSSTTSGCQNALAMKSN